MRAVLLVAALAGLLSGPASAEDAGAALFDAHCAACHNTGGIGTPGLAPPLNRPDFWQALGDKAPTYISGIVTKGFAKPITVNGERYMGLIMVPVAGTTDEELAQITSWVLSDLGQTDQSVTLAQIAEMRASMTTQDDLKALRPPTE
ncbi:nitrite reductase (NO-forming) [Gemmobacter caeni]|uniref:Cbb3-type cytochrome c oxidase subunit III n=1 Tax=Gemmobacter caeni TaxID=589035 RepID=A0A2T6ABT2_9RHOB|nr:cytochrome c [Gemmobacter caeni]PTX41232.1 cbb3-type cytochrome c oxidase subunit III [Gemmobacter caeni]TWI89950.1 nitrite reductase (NO-forming) [Gemmobacter caeni]